MVIFDEEFSGFSRAVDMLALDVVSAAVLGSVNVAVTYIELAAHLRSVDVTIADVISSVAHPSAVSAQSDFLAAIIIFIASGFCEWSTTSSSISPNTIIRSAPL